MRKKEDEGGGGAAGWLEEARLVRVGGTEHEMRVPEFLPGDQ